jgi:hypothetical protein
VIPSDGEEGIDGRGVNEGVGLYSVMEMRFIMDYTEMGSKNEGSLTHCVIAGDEEGK